MRKGIHYGMMIFASVIIFGGITYYYFIDDPVSYKLVIDCNDPYFADNLDCTNNPYLKSIEVSTHLKTGINDYTVNITDGIGTASP